MHAHKSEGDINVLTLWPVLTCDRLIDEGAPRILRGGQKQVASLVNI